MENAPSPTRRKDWRIQDVLDGIAAFAMTVASMVLILVIARSMPQTGSITIASKDSVPNRATIPISGEVATKGSDKAPIVLVQFSDFECPFCIRFALETLPKLEQQYVAAGKVQIAFRHFPLTGAHPYAFGAAVAAECARRQGEFWRMHDLLFSGSQSLSPDHLRIHAKSLRLDLTRFTKCSTLEAPAVVKADLVEARALGVGATPTFLLLRRTNSGETRPAGILRGFVTFPRLVAKLEEMLRQQGPRN